MSSFLCSNSRQRSAEVQSRGRGQCRGAVQRGAWRGAGSSHCGRKRHTPGEHCHPGDRQGLYSSSWRQAGPGGPYLRGIGDSAKRRFWRYNVIHSDRGFKVVRIILSHCTVCFDINILSLVSRYCILDTLCSSESGYSRKTSSVGNHGNDGVGNNIWPNTHVSTAWPDVAHWLLIGAVSLHTNVFTVWIKLHNISSFLPLIMHLCVTQ